MFKMQNDGKYSMALILEKIVDAFTVFYAFLK